MFHSMQFFCQGSLFDNSVALDVRLGRKRNQCLLTFSILFIITMLQAVLSPCVFGQLEWIQIDVATLVKFALDTLKHPETS